MPKYRLSVKSWDRLKTCDRRLWGLVFDVLEFMDVIVTCGYRCKEDQEKAFEQGKSKAHFGESKHNAWPSKAVDIVPCKPINWDAKDPRWEIMCNIVEYFAKQKGINIKLGRDFKNLKDYPHIELVE